MQITCLTVVNFRAITRIELRNLPPSVVIAGPNGCGKSCVFDAIRLLKSVYGGYQPNEWQNWFGEFQITLNQRQGELLPLFQDRSQPLEVAVDIVLAPSEVEYLRREAQSLLKIRPGRRSCLRQPICDILALRLWRRNFERTNQKSSVTRKWQCRSS